MSKKGIIGHAYVINGEYREGDSLRPGMSVDTWYEVVRIIDQKALFLTDHMARLSRSMTKSGQDSLSPDTIRHNLGVLLSHSKITDGNIRICIQKRDPLTQDLICYFVPHRYPQESMYRKGIRMLSFPYERPRPGIKKWDQDFRTRVNAFIESNGIYEALLVGPLEEIREGSRSNVFFIRSDGSILTPPANQVLEGITRKYLMEICKSNKIDVLEETISIKDLKEMKAAFISGTSPGILPVRQIDNYQLDPAHPLEQLLMKEYCNLVDENLETII